MNFNETLKSNGTKHMVPLTSYHLIRLAKDRKWARETLSSDRLCVQKVYKHSRNLHKKVFHDIIDFFVPDVCSKHIFCSKLLRKAKIPPGC